MGHARVGRTPHLLALGGIVLVLSLVVAPVHPVAACSCGIAAPSDPPRAYGPDDVVFVGIATGRDAPSERSLLPIRSSDAPVYWTFNVEQILHGSIPGSPRVVSAESSASCGFTFQLGQRYTVRSHRGGGELRVGLCDMIDQTGRPDTTVPVTPVVLLPEQPRPPTPAPQAVAATDATSTPEPPANASIHTWIGVGILALLAVVIGTTVWAERTR